MDVNKFRAWDIRNKKMVEDALVLSGTGQLVTVNASYFNSPFSFFDGCIWMQYVNIKDKNGREIYEDDIVRFWTYSTKNSRKGIVSRVQFNNSQLLPFYDDSYIQDEQGDWFVDSKGFEVIGNIHENPELLKQ